jgi:hypothetical protein
VFNISGKHGTAVIKPYGRGDCGPDQRMLAMFVRFLDNTEPPMPMRNVLEAVHAHVAQMGRELLGPDEGHPADLVVVMQRANDGIWVVDSVTVNSPQKPIALAFASRLLASGLEGIENEAGIRWHAACRDLPKEKAAEVQRPQGYWVADYLAHTVEELLTACPFMELRPAVPTDL